MEQAHYNLSLRLTKAKKNPKILKATTLGLWKVNSSSRLEREAKTWRKTSRGVNSLAFPLLSPGFDPRVAQCGVVQGVQATKTLARQPGKGVPVSWRGWGRSMWFFPPSFFSHSPAPRMAPVMDLHCSGSLKLRKKPNQTKKHISVGKGDMVVWRCEGISGFIFFPSSLFSSAALSQG